MYTINGELPKGTHEIIQANRSPDFLIHRPKSMASNLAIIEVKQFSVVRVFSNLDKDLGKLNFSLGSKRSIAMESRICTATESKREKRKV